MTAKQRRILLWTVTCVAIVVAITFTLFSWSTNYNYCVRNNGSHYSGQYSDNDKPIIVPAFAGKLGGFRLFMHCGGVFTEQHSGAITAAATILLLAVTALLSWIAYMQFTTTRAQLRAYLSVVVGGGSWQDRKANIRFEANPLLVNDGETPAYKVRYRAKAEIIPDSLVENYIFDVPETDQVSQASIGPGQNRFMSAVVPNYINDAEIDATKRGNGQALWVWGLVQYEDAFGAPHTVKFCQRVTWLYIGTPKETTFGVYNPRWSDSD